VRRSSTYGEPCCWAGDIESGISNLRFLAQHAIESVKKAEAGKDGISYLMRAIASGIDTPLSKSYVAEVQRITGTDSLSQALKKARS
jgi:hypothetical protein